MGPWEFLFPQWTLSLPCGLTSAEIICCCSTLLATIPFQCNQGKLAYAEVQSDLVLGSRRHMYLFSFAAACIYLLFLKPFIDIKSSLKGLV